MARNKNPQAKARLKFARHRAQAKFRNIDFNFTFEDWYDWWLSNGVDKNLEIHWAPNTRPCMCRYNDQGPYEINNVYFATHVENVRDAITNNRANPHGKRTVCHYRWGSEAVTLEKFTRIAPHISATERSMFRVENYDAANIYESNKLKHRYEHYVLMSTKQRKTWITPAGEFDNLQDAADSVGIPRANFQWQVNAGKWERRIVVLLSLNDYIKQNSRFPDPVLFPEEPV